MEFSLAVWLLVLTAVIGAVLMAYERRTRRIDRSYNAFSPTVAALLVWILAYAAELASTDRSLMLLFANIQFIGIGAVPGLVFVTVRQFLGRPALRPRFGVAAGVIPAVTVLFAFTDGSLGLLRDSVAVVRDHGMVQLDVAYGLWHNAVFVPYQFAFYLAALFLLVDAGMRGSRLFRSRFLIFAGGIALPMVGGLFYVLDLTPFAVLNPTSVLIMFSFTAFGVVMLRHQARDIVPVAHEQVLNTLEEGIIVLDLDDRIVDFNTAAAAFFVGLNQDALGMGFADRLGENDAILALARGVDDSGVGFTVEGPAGVTSCLGRSSQVIGVDGSRIGRLITISDITDRVGTGSEAGVILSRPDFFGVAGRALADAVKSGKPYHIASVVLPTNAPPDSVESISRILRDRLKSGEHASFTGGGRFFLSLPGADKDGTLLRVRELSLVLGALSSKLRFGIAGVREGGPETVEEMAVRAIRAATGGRPGISYAR